VKRRDSILEQTLACDACGACNPCGAGWPQVMESRLPRGRVWAIRSGLLAGKSPAKIARDIGAGPLHGSAGGACPRGIDIARIELELRSLDTKEKEHATRISANLKHTKNALGVEYPSWDWAGTAIRARLGTGGRTLVLGGTINTHHPELQGGPMNELAEALRTLQLDFHFLGPDEPNLGWELLCAGDVDTARKVAGAALVKLKIARPERVVSPDAAVVCCIRSVWPELLQKEIPFEVLHTAELLIPHICGIAPSGNVVPRIELHPGDEAFIAGIDARAAADGLANCGYEVSNSLFIDRNAPCACCGWRTSQSSIPETAGAGIPTAIMTASCRFASERDGPAFDLTELIARAILGRTASFY